MSTPLETARTMIAQYGVTAAEVHAEYNLTNSRGDPTGQSFWQQVRGHIAASRTAT